MAFYSNLIWRTVKGFKNFPSKSMKDLIVHTNLNDSENSPSKSAPKNSETEKTDDFENKSKSNFRDLARFTNDRRKSIENETHTSKSDEKTYFSVRLAENDVIEIRPEKIATVNVIIYGAKDLICIEKLEITIPGLKRVDARSIPMSPNCSKFNLSLRNISNTTVIYHSYTMNHILDLSNDAN